MARPARYDSRRVLPQAARHFGRLPAVMHGFALRAVSLARRNSVAVWQQPSPNHVVFCQIKCAQYSSGVHSGAIGEGSVLPPDAFAGIRLH